MSCRACKKKLVESGAVITSEKSLERQIMEYDDTIDDLHQCFDCAKKHIGRAQIFYEEYHTGYPMHIKLSIECTSLVEMAVQQAFLKRRKAMAHMDMASCELVGDEQASQYKSFRSKIIELANRIRDIRLQMETDPLMAPPFDEILIEIQRLQYQTSGLPSESGEN